MPIVNFAFTATALDDYALRRVAEECESRLQSVPNTGHIYIVGGQPRRALVQLDPLRMAAYGVSAGEITRAVRAANVSLPAGAFSRENQQVLVTRASRCARLTN